MAVQPTIARTADQWQTRRAARFEARYAQWDISGLRRVRSCGRSVTSKSEAVTVLASGSAADGTRRAGLGGVQSCGSVWSCPVCAQKIQARRQAEVASALAVARLRGWEVLFVTLTMRHSRDHRLKALWDHLGAAWGAVTTGPGQRAWKRDRADYGIRGYLRLVEVTHGDQSGWHVHAHVLLFCDPSAAELFADLERPAGVEHGAGFTDDEVQALGVRMFLRWRGALNLRGIRPSLRRGVDIRRVRSDEKISEYFAKQLYRLKGEGSTAHDVTGSHGKEAKNGNRTPFGILGNLVHLARTGEITDASERDLDLWHTFEKASKGRRQLLWARGFRAEMLDDAEIDDQTIVDEAPGGEELTRIEPALWKQLVRRRLIGDLLLMAEADDTGFAVRKWLAAGLDFYHPDRPV